MEEVCNKKVPTLMAAGLIGSQMVGGDKKAGLSLKLRMQKLKESIIRQATMREARMHDEEERAAIDGALRALEGGEAADLESAKRLLRERLAHVQRRVDQARNEGDDDDSSSSSEDEEEAEGRGDGGGSGASALRAEGDIREAKYWLDLIGGRDGELTFTLGDEGDGSPELPLEASRARRSELHSRGFLSLGGVLPADLARETRALISDLQRQGWPPIFAFVYDAPWRLVASAWALVEDLMGGPCLLEPSFTAFQLNHARDRAGERYMGTNFGLPHRDYTFADSTFADSGAPKVLSVWLPLNEVTVENGCMYVVPREFDRNFDKDGAYEHKMVMGEGGLKGTQFLHFPLDGIRPLPGTAGHLMCWYGNAIHWGSSCHAAGARDPRASLALVFRRADAAQNFAQPCLSRQDVQAAGLPQRLGRVKDALGCFGHWYSVDKALAQTLEAATAKEGGT